MKIIYNIQYAILRSIFYFSIVFSGCTSFRHHVETRHPAGSVSRCFDLCSKTIIEIGLDKISENSTYRLFGKWFKPLIQKSESRQMKYPLHTFVKYFKQVQKYFDSLPLIPSLKDKCIASFIDSYVADINVLKPTGNFFSNLDAFLDPDETLPTASPLHLAVKPENLNIPLVRCLLQPGVDVNLRNSKGDTSFHQVIKNGSMDDLGKLLLDAGANPNLRDGYGCLPLSIVIESKCREKGIKLMQLLLDAGADPNLRDGYDWLPLSVAIEKKNLKSMQLLLDAGADPNLPDSKGNTPLHLATKNHYLAGIQLLISHGANVNQPNYKGSIPLHIAALSCRKGIWDFLCTQGSDMYRVNHAGHTPLYLQATRQGRMCSCILTGASLPFLCLIL